MEFHLFHATWVYKVKRKSDRSIERHKARLVARGFSQKYGVYFDETYSPVAKLTTVKVLISLAASKGWRLWQMDVKNAFLYGDLDKEIYMEQPPGWIVLILSLFVNVRKALYGLKQAPRAWYGNTAESLLFCGYSLSDADSSILEKVWLWYAFMLMT